MALATAPAWREATLQAQCAGEIDLPCPPPPPLSVAVQAPGATRELPITAEFTISGIAPGSSLSVTAAVNGAAVGGVTWQLGSNGTSASGSFAVGALNAGQNTVSVTASDGMSPVASASTTVEFEVPPPPMAARAQPIVTPEPLSQYRRSFVGCAGCSYATLTYSTPAYRSLDVERALTLVYSSALSAPTGLVSVDVSPNSTESPSKASIALIYNGTIVGLVSGGTEAFYSVNSAGNYRLTAVFDAAGFSSGTYNMTAVVRNWWADGAMQETQAPVRVLIANERTSGFGSGWGVAGLSRIVINSANDAAIFDGTAMVVFPSCGASCWTPPPAEPSTLVHVGSTIERRYPDGTVQVFDATTGLLQQVHDRFGLATSYAYDAYGRPYRITDPAGLTTTINWSGTPGSASVADITTPGNRTARVSTDGMGQLGNITDPDNVPALSLGYANNRIVSATDRIGGTTDFQYDQYGGLAAVLSPLVETTDRGFARSATTYSSRELALLPAAGKGSAGAPGDLVLPQFAWLRIRSQRGDSVRFTVNGIGDPTEVVKRNAQGKLETTTIEYNAAGQPTRQNSTAGTGQVYDWNGWLLAKIHDLPSLLITEFTYNALGQRLITTVDGVLQEQNFYSPDTRSVLDSSTTGNATTRFTYDGVGRVLTVKDGAQHQTSFSYQTIGYLNLATVTTSDGTTQLGYDAFGRPSGGTDAAGRTSSTELDVLGRTVRAVAPDQSITAWTYDDANRSYSLTDAKNQVYRTILNAQGAPTFRFDPLNHADAYHYDSDGNVTSMTSRGGRTVSTVYDVMERPIQISAGGLTMTIAYDTAGKWTAYSNAESIDTVFVDGNGRVTSQVTVRSGRRYVVATSYGDLGALSGLSVSSSAWSGVRSLTFGVDEIGRQDFLSDFGGKGTAITYNQDHQPQTITLPTGTSSSRLVESFQYLANDRLSGVTHNLQANLLDHWYAYDPLRRLTLLGRGVAGDGSYRRVSYNLAGRLSQAADTTMTSEHPIICPPDESEACYPDESQLIVSYTPGMLESYTYDVVGNRTDRGAVVTTGNRLTSFDGYTMTYDDDGNMLTKSGNGASWSFSWNALGQLESVTRNGVTTTFGYDGLGRRVRKTTNGVTTAFLYDGDNLVMQLNGAGQPTLEFSYYPGVDHPHALRQSATGTLFYYVTTQPGHVTALVNQSNQVVNRYEYTPFGKAIATTEQVVQPFRFAAREFDSETGLYYNRARYYDPTLARFVSEDPIGLAGGVNQYAYAGDDPVNATDPTGLSSECISWWTRGDRVSTTLGGVTTITETPGYWSTFCWDNGENDGPTVAPSSPGGPGGSIGPASPKPVPNIHLKALNCGFHTSAAALAAVTDLSVARGIGLGYKMGQGIAGKTSLMAKRWLAHEVDARYLFGPPEHATMAHIGRSTANVAVGTALYVGTTASSGGDFDWWGFLSNFVPIVNFWNAATDAYDVCKP